MNFAAVQRAPVVFVCENNLYATATPLTVDDPQHRGRQQGRRLRHPGVAVDGNDVLAVWVAMRGHRPARPARARP